MWKTFRHGIVQSDLLLLTTPATAGLHHKKLLDNNAP